MYFYIHLPLSSHISAVSGTIWNWTWSPRSKKKMRGMLNWFPLILPNSTALRRLFTWPDYILLRITSLKLDLCYKLAVIMFLTSYYLHKSRWRLIRLSPLVRHESLICMCTGKCHTHYKSNVFPCLPLTFLLPI